jgi:hypothetical protein
MTDRLQLLITTNIEWLGQAEALLDRISDQAYVAVPSGLAPHRAGGHLRHIVEFYECFLVGLPEGSVDYDARKRDPLVESCRRAARERIRRVIGRLETEPRLRADSNVRVSMEDSGGSGIADPFVISSIGRELQALSSHTIHHFALMALTLRALGVSVDPDFGIAPSTLRFLGSRSEEAA